MIIAICNGSRQTGCSSLARAISVYLNGELATDTLLLDCCDNEDSFEWALRREQNIVPVKCMHAKSLQREQLNELILKHDHIVIDAECFAEEPTQTILSYADLVLISLRPMWQDLQQVPKLEAFVKGLTEHNALQNIHVVINKASPNEGLISKNRSAQALIRMHKLPVLNCMLHYFDFYNTLNEFGLSIFDQYPKEVSASEVKAVINEMLAVSLDIEIPAPAKMSQLENENAMINFHLARGIKKRHDAAL